LNAGAKSYEIHSVQVPGRAALATGAHGYAQRAAYAPSFVNESILIEMVQLLPKVLKAIHEKLTRPCHSF
jgi:hypothetical protein